MPRSNALSAVRRALRWHRRLFAAMFAALAVYCALAALTDSDNDTAVIAAAHAIPGGAVVGPGDLTTLSLPADAVPEGALTSADQVIGRTVVAPVPGRGVLTSSSLTSSGDLVDAGRLAVPVTLDDSAPIGMLSVGDRIDLLGIGGSGVFEVLAQGVRVVAIPSSDPGGGLLGSGAPVVLVDLSRQEAARVVAAAAGSPLGFALR